MAKRVLNILLYDDFEILDAMGPAEMFGRLQDEFCLVFVSQNGGLIKSFQQAQVYTIPFAEMDKSGILLVPGGCGHRLFVKDEDYLAQLKALMLESPYVLSVCTGSVLLAKTGLLDGRKATSNKLLFDWVVSQGPQVHWQKKARWVVDGKYYTASGVTAGMDMALCFIEDLLGKAAADKAAMETEYLWNRDSTNDPFAVE